MTMNGVEVTIGGKAAPIVTVTPNMVAVQVPFDVELGTQPVVLKNAVGTARAVTPTSLAPHPPFGADCASDPQRPTRRSVTPDNPVAADEDIWIWTTGLGQTTPALTTGRYTPGCRASAPTPSPATVGCSRRDGQQLHRYTWTPRCLPCHRARARRIGVATAATPRMGNTASNTVMLYVK